MDGAQKFLSLLEALARHQVEFIVVGGVAAVLEGAPISTFDLDVVYHRTEENLPRLLAALGELEAVYRDPAGRRIKPDASRLATIGNHPVHTKFRPLDVLHTIGDGLTYSDLLSRTRERQVGDVVVRVLDLAAVIESKEQANRDKDRAALPVLRQTLRLRGASLL